MKITKLILKGSKITKSQNFRTLFLISFFFSALFFGCRQGDKEQTLTPTLFTLNKTNLKNLENWYQDKINPLIQQKNKSIIFHPKWGEGVLQALNDGTQLAIFPVWREMPIRYYELGFLRRLVIRLDSQGEVIEGKIMEMVSTKPYLYTYKDEIPKWFYNGTLKNQQAVVWQYPIAEEDTQFKNSEDCGELKAEYYAADCRLTLYNACGAQVFFACIDNEGGSGSSGEYNWLNYYDWGNTTGGSGGSSTTGSGSVYTPCEQTDMYGNCLPVDEGGNVDVTINSRIDGSLLDSCMKSILADIQALSEGSVGNIILKLNGYDPRYNWKLIQGNLQQNEYGATSQSYDRTTGTVTTTFDANKFQQASDLSIARTIIHESIHAYLVAYFKTDPITANKNYLQLVEDFRKSNGDLNLAHHEEFARSFVQPIAESLRDFSYFRGYMLPMQYYWDLAWGGLEGTTYFNNLSEIDKKRIRDVVRIELTGKDSNGNTKTQEGKKSGC